MGCQSQHFWANPYKCIISNINQTRSKLTTPGPYFEYCVLLQYLTHIYNQFTTVSFTVIRHSSIAHHIFKFTVNTTVSMESVDLVDLVCAKATWLRTSRAGSPLSLLWGSHHSTDSWLISPNLHKNVEIKLKIQVLRVNYSETDYFPNNSNDHI